MKIKMGYFFSTQWHETLWKMEIFVKCDIHIYIVSIFFLNLFQKFHVNEFLTNFNTNLWQKYENLKEKRKTSISEITWNRDKNEC